ncbi:Bromo domain-containing protein [Pseudoscourfieldia marina]
MDDSSDLEDTFFNDVHETLTTDDAHDLPITLTEQASEDEPKNRDAMDVDDVVTRTPATPKALAVTSTEQDDDDEEEEDGDTTHALAIVDDPWMCDARLVAWEDSIKDYYLKDEDKTDDDSFLLRTTSQPEQQQQLPQTISIATTATPTQTPTVSALLSSRATTPASSQQQPLKLKFTLSSSSMLSKEPAQPQQQKPVVQQQQQQQQQQPPPKPPPKKSAAVVPLTDLTRNTQVIVTSHLAGEPKAKDDDDDDEMESIAAAAWQQLANNKSSDKDQAMAHFEEIRRMCTNALASVAGNVAATAAAAAAATANDHRDKEEVQQNQQMKVVGHAPPSAATLPYRRKPPKNDVSYTSMPYPLVRLEGTSHAPSFHLDFQKAVKETINQGENILLRFNPTIEQALTRAHRQKPSAVLLDPNDRKQTFEAINSANLSAKAWKALLSRAATETPALVLGPQPQRIGGAHMQAATFAVAFHNPKDFHTTRAVLTGDGACLSCVPDFLLALSLEREQSKQHQQRQAYAITQGDDELLALTGGSQTTERKSSEGKAPLAKHSEVAAYLGLVHWHLSAHALLLWHRPRHGLAPPPLPRMVEHPAKSPAMTPVSVIGLYLCTVSGNKIYIPQASVGKSLKQLWMESTQASQAIDGKRTRRRPAVASFQEASEKLGAALNRVKADAPDIYPAVRDRVADSSAGARFFLRCVQKKRGAPALRMRLTSGQSLDFGSVQKSRPYEPITLDADLPLRDLPHCYKDMHVYVAFTFVAPLRSHNIRPPATDHQSAPYAFTFSRHLSLAEEPVGYSHVVEHVVEERPPLLPNLGMGANIVTYHRRSAVASSQDTDSDLPPPDVAPGHVVTLTDEPGPLLGIMNPGDSIPCFETTLSRHTYHRHGGIAAREAAKKAAREAAAADAAVAAKEAEWDAENLDGDDDDDDADKMEGDILANDPDADVACEATELNDFLLIRRPDGRYYIREIDQAASLGQSQPLERPKIPEPHTEEASKCYEDAVKAYAYKEFRKEYKKKNQPGVEMNALIRSFPWLCNGKEKHYEKLDLDIDTNFSEALTKSMEPRAAGGRDDHMRGYTLDLTESRSLRRFVDEDYADLCESAQRHVERILNRENAIQPYATKEAMFYKKPEFRLREDQEIAETCSLEKLCALEAMRAGLVHLRSVGISMLVQTDDVRKARALLSGVQPISQWTVRPCAASSTSPEISAVPRRFMKNRQRLPAPKSATPIPPHLRAARRLEEELHMSPWSWVTQYREAWHDQKGLLKGTGYGSEEHPSFGRPHIFNLLKAWVPRDRSGGRDRSGAGSGLHALEPGSLNDSKEALTALHLVAGDACLALMGGDQATAPSRARQRAPKVSTAAAEPMEVEGAPQPPSAAGDKGKEPEDGGDEEPGKKRKKSQIKQPSQIQNSDADLRRLTMPQMVEILKGYGETDESIKGMARWDRIRAIRKYASEAAAGGNDKQGTSRFAREKRVSQNEQRTKLLQALDRIFSKQRSMLSRTDPPPPLPVRETEDVDPEDEDGNARTAAPSADPEAKERADFEALRAMFAGGASGTTSKPSGTNGDASASAPAKPMEATERVRHIVHMKNVAALERYNPEREEAREKASAKLAEYAIVAPMVVSDVRAIIDKKYGRKERIQIGGVSKMFKITSFARDLPPDDQKGAKSTNRALNKSRGGGGSTRDLLKKKVGDATRTHPVAPPPPSTQQQQQQQQSIPPVKLGFKRPREARGEGEAVGGGGGGGGATANAAAAPEAVEAAAAPVPAAQDGGQPRPSLKLKLSGVALQRAPSAAQLKRPKAEEDSELYTKNYSLPGDGRKTQRQKSRGVSSQYEKARKEFNDELLSLARFFTKDYEIFTKAVPKKLVPDYHKFVSNPMFLKKIQDKCVKQHYDSKESFMTDIRAIAKAAHDYNDNPDAVYKNPDIAPYADRLVEFANGEISSNANLNVKLHHLNAAADGGDDEDGAGADAGGGAGAGGDADAGAGAGAGAGVAASAPQLPPTQL